MYKIVTTLQELPKWDLALPVFADIETEGLYTDIRLIQFYQPETDEQVYILDLAPTGYDINSYQLLVKELKIYLQSLWTAFYNASYDLGTLNISPNKFDDIYYAVKLAYPEFGTTGFGLKKIVKNLRYTQGMYDSTEEDTGSKGYPKGAYISASAYRYAAIDVIAIGKIWGDAKIRNVVENSMSYKVDILSMGYALIYQQNGLKVDREAVNKELASSKDDVVKYSAMLPAGFNPNSYKQVRELLNITKSDRDALVEYALSSAPNAQYADTIIRLKRAKKEVTYLKSVSFNTMYTKYNVAGAVSGRFSASGGDLVQAFNAQQIPRNFQYIFNQPDEDTVIIDADYSTLELRLAATIFNEPVMYKQLKNGEDLHTAMAMQTTGKKLHPDGVIKVDGSLRDLTDEHKEFVTDKDRQNAKAINFGFVFGMSAKSFIVYARTAFGVIYTEREAEAVRAKYFQMYKSIGKYHKNVWNNYKKSGFLVYTALGRPIKPKLGTDGINGPVQGSGADTMKLAVHYLVKDNPEYPMLKWVYSVVHDACYMRVPRTEDYKHIGDLLNQAMLKAWDEMGKTKAFHFKDIPMIAEIEIKE